MAIRDILVFPDEGLRRVAIPVKDVRSDAVHHLVQDLADTMYNAPGVGLAATQIGVDLRVVVTDTEWRQEGAVRDLHVWINPEILSFSDEKAIFEEGCLSVPDIYEEVERPSHIHLRWLDLDGNRHEAEFDGFEAVALQHEFDHLDGKLFIDKLSTLKQNLIKKKLRKRKKLAVV